MGKINFTLSHQERNRSEKLRLGPNFFDIQLALHCIRITLKATGDSFTSHLTKQDRNVWKTMPGPEFFQLALHSIRIA